MIKGISHIGLEVRYPEKTARMFEEVFSARVINKKADNENQPEWFLCVAGTWFALIEGDGPRSRTDDHIAIAVSEKDLDKFASRLAKLGLEHRFSKTETPPRSLYFFDYDNHFFEISVGFLPDELLRAGA